MRSRLLGAALLAAPTLLHAQGAASKPAKAALPAGWHVHLDRASMPADYTVQQTGTGLHVKTVESAGTLFDSKMTAAGNYSLQATLTQTKAPAHPEAYGVIFGGSSLDTDAQSYMYFVIRGDGKFLINHRAGSEVHKLVDWTANPGIHAADASGEATNALRVDVGTDSVRFSVNGARVHTLPRSNVQTNGLVGLRVNHALDVQIEGPKIVK